MYPFLFTGLAFATAGSICALIGDLQKRPGLGLFGLFALNLTAWARLIHSFFGGGDLLEAAALFTLAHICAAFFYIGAMHFLDGGREDMPEALALTE